MSMRYWKIFVLSGLLLAGCQKEPSSQKEEPVAVRIGDNYITQADVEARRKFLSPQDQEFAKTPVGYQNLVQIIAREKLIVADAKHNRLDQDADYQELLRQKRAELDRVYDDFATQLLTQFWYAKQQTDGPITVTDKEIKEYYDKYPYEMTIKQIIVDNAQTADQTLRTLKGSPASWATLSKQLNIAPEELRTLSFMPGEYISNLEVVAANSAVGKVQGFFKTAQGFHIIMKTGEKRLTFEEAQPRIRQVLENQKLDELLDSLKTQYEVIIYDKNE